MQPTYNIFTHKTKNMKKTFLLIIAFGCFCINSNAQSVPGKTFRASFMYIESLVYSPYAANASIISENSEHLWGYAIMLDADLWQLSRNFSAGVHLGFSPSSYRIVTNEHSSLGVHYGIDLSYNMLPDCDRWNVSINGTVGSYWAFYKMPYLSYGASLRAEYYPLKHFGFFAELGWGKYLFTSHATVRYGETMAKIGLSYRL